MKSAQLEPSTRQFHGADGLTLIADEWNDAGSAEADAGPSVLMLHGGGQNRFSWKKTGQILASRGLHVVALDSRGHGDSDRSPDAKYTIEALCADTLRVIHQIGRPVVLIGASMGGLTGILAARQARPGRVVKLVLVDVVPRYEKDGSARIREFMFSHIHGFDSLDQAADAVAAYLPHRTKPSSPEGLKKNLRHRNGRWYWHWDPAFLTKPGDDPFARVDKLETAATNLSVPILLTIWDGGGRDMLNLSRHSHDQRIDLRPGAFSDVLGWKGTLGIAYGTAIEDARGGRGADWVIGNGTANRIWGHQGDDQQADGRDDHEDHAVQPLEIGRQFGGGGLEAHATVMGFAHDGKVLRQCRRGGKAGGTERGMPEKAATAGLTRQFGVEIVHDKALLWPACESACKKDPVSGGIGV